MLEKALVAENSGIYSILMELLLDVPIICSSGQFTFAVWQLLRKLAYTGTIIYYSGDIDLEGLGMAQIQFLGMKQHHFQIPKTEVPPSANRLKRLKSF